VPENFIRPRWEKETERVENKHNTTYLRGGGKEKSLRAKFLKKNHFEKGKNSASGPVSRLGAGRGGEDQAQNPAPSTPPTTLQSRSQKKLGTFPKKPRRQKQQKKTGKPKGHNRQPAGVNKGHHRSRSIQVLQSVLGCFGGTQTRPQSKERNKPGSTKTSETVSTRTRVTCPVRGAAARRNTALAVSSNKNVGSEPRKGMKKGVFSTLGAEGP